MIVRRPTAPESGHGGSAIRPHRGDGSVQGSINLYPLRLVRLELIILPGQSGLRQRADQHQTAKLKPKEEQIDEIETYR